MPSAHLELLCTHIVSSLFQQGIYLKNEIFVLRPNMTMIGVWVPFYTFLANVAPHTSIDRLKISKDYQTSDLHIVPRRSSGEQGGG
jgi:hypothetical protein